MMGRMVGKRVDLVRDHEVMGMGQMGKGMLRRGEGDGKRVLGMMVGKRVLVVMRDDLMRGHRVGKGMAERMEMMLLVLEVERNGHGMVSERK